MPAWLIQLLIGLATKLGPYALKALLPRLPDWAKVITEELIKAIEGASAQVLDAKEVKTLAINKAKLALKNREGVGSPPSLKA